MTTTPRRIRVVVSPLVLAVALGLLAKDALFEEDERSSAKDGSHDEPVADTSNDPWLSEA